MVRSCRRASLGDGRARGWSADRDFMRGKIQVILDVFSVSTATGVGKVAVERGGAAGRGFAGGGGLCYRYA
jgi:hypothetical protein